jgi:hypothetical protein
MLTASNSGRDESFALRRDPVEAAQIPAQQPIAGVVEDLDRPDPDPRGDADDTRPVVDRADRAGDVCAMAVAVLPRRRRRVGAAVAADDVEICHPRHARVDDRDVGVDPRAGAVAGRGGRRPRGTDPGDAGRDQLAREGDPLVGDDRGDAGFFAKPADLGFGQVRRVPAERVPIGAIGGEPDLPALVRGLRLCVGTGLEQHDPAPGRVGIEGVRSGLGSGRRTRHRGKKGEGGDRG